MSQRRNPSRPRQRRPNQSRSLLVSVLGYDGGEHSLPLDMEVYQLGVMFSDYKDQVTEMKVVTNSKLHRVGKVTFKSAANASEAMCKLQGRDDSILLRYWTENDNLKSSAFNSKSKVRGAALSCSEDDKDQESCDKDLRTLYVKIRNFRIPDARDDITNRQLWSHFDDYKEHISSANVIFDHATNLPRGFAFITLKSRKAASKCIQIYNETELCGKYKLHLSFKRKKSVSGAGPKPKSREMAANVRSENNTIEFKDGVVGHLLMENHEYLAALSAKMGVELHPLPSPSIGFRMIGKPQRFREIIEFVNKHREDVERNGVGYGQIVLDSSYKQIYSASEINECKMSLKRNFNVISKCSLDKHFHSGLVTRRACLRVCENHVVDINIIKGCLNEEKTDAIVIPTASGQTCSLDSGNLPCSYIIQAHLSVDSPSCDTAIKDSLTLAADMHLGSISFLGMKPQMVESIVNCLCSMGPTTLHTVGVVPENTSIYVEELTGLILSSKMSKPEPKIEPKDSVAIHSAATMDSNANSEYVWSRTRRNDSDSFTPYPQSVSDALNRSFNALDEDCCFCLDRACYMVFFTTMTQVNLDTAEEQEVKRVLTSKPIGNDVTVSWRYMDDYKRFMSYSPANCSQIEAMFQKESVSNHLVIQGRTYAFDFAAMKQINVKTGYNRALKRDPPVSPGAECVSFGSNSSRTNPVFLCGNEVVINIKGPLQSVADATKTLKKKLEALLFLKEISYPSDSTHSLLQGLQAIADKHEVSCTVGKSNDLGASIVTQKRVLKLEGLESSVTTALTEIQADIIRFQESIRQLPKHNKGGSCYPLEWETMLEKDTVKIVNLSASSPSYSQVCALFNLTMLPDFRVVEIKQVQNKWLYDRYIQTTISIHKKNAGRVNELELFHGTRQKPAEIICTSEEGFDMRHSREGMWGQANYFAKKASYSDTYAHHDHTNGTKQMILARVLTGDSLTTNRDSSLRLPPEKPRRSNEDGQLQQVRYDSVNGETNGSVVYMTYANDRAYPAYIITYLAASCPVPAIYTQLPTPAAPPQRPPAWKAPVVPPQWPPAPRKAPVAAPRAPVAPPQWPPAPRKAPVAPLRKAPVAPLRKAPVAPPQRPPQAPVQKEPLSSIRRMVTPAPPKKDGNCVIS